MIHLRSMLLEDLTIFRKWLHASHVAPWYPDAADWINEVEKQRGDFKWIHHFIVEDGEIPIGFCQYYSCDDSLEPMGGYTALGGTYSMDYLIGEEEYLRKGCGKQLVTALIEKVRLHSDAKRIAVSPDKENKASHRLLLSCGFSRDAATNVFVKELR